MRKKFFKKSLPVKISFTAVVSLIIFFCFVSIFLPHDPYQTDLSHALLKPGTEGYLLGTDHVGRCLACRILSGGRITLLSSLCVVGIIFVTGTILGAVSGFVGGWLDALIGKITTIFQAFPGFVLAVAIAGILGPGRWNGILALSLVYWTTYARYARSLVISCKDASYIRAARMCGASTVCILFKYIFPDMIPLLIVMASMDIGNVTLSMAGLSFIGLGTARPTAEWGAMMSESRQYLQTAPWTIICPGIALFVIVLVFNLFGDSLRDFLDKKHRQENNL